MNSKPFPAVWVPGDIGYNEHLDRYIYSLDNVMAIKEQTTQLKNSINQQSNEFRNIITDSNEQLASSLRNGLQQLSHNIIASNEQLVSAIDEGFERLSDINETGFYQVTSAIEELNSNLQYFSGVIIQKLEYQNTVLNGILYTLQEPIETLIKEQYHKGWTYIQKEDIDRAVKYLKESISLKNGEDFFYSHYQLGRLYLYGINEKTNIVDPKIASKYLLVANELGDGEIKINKSFSPVLADCKFFLSLSYYAQLSGENNPDELNLLNSAIQYGKEATILNPNLSQAWYNLTKYYSFRCGLFTDFNNKDEIENLLICYLKAIEIDRNYLRAIVFGDPFYDKALEPVNEEIIKLINSLIDIKRKDANMLLKKAQNYIQLLEEKDILNSSNYATAYLKLKEIFLEAEKDFKIDTYFGYDDCLIKLDTL